MLGPQSGIHGSVLPFVQSKRTPRCADLLGGIESMQQPATCDLLDVPVACIDTPEAIEIVSSWVGSDFATRLVTFTNVHMLVEGNRDPAFRKMLCAMDMNCSDGMPLVWMGRLRSKPMSRVCGPDFMPTFCATTADRGYRHYFYGGNEGVAETV